MNIDRSTKRRSPPDWLPTEGYTEENLGIIKGGKEAVVWLVERSAGEASCLLALKAYKPRLERSFRRDSLYQEGWQIKERTIRKAVQKRTKFGQQAIEAIWTGNEFSMLRLFWREGADVPYPVEQPVPSSLLMQYVGDWDEAAPRLSDVRLAPESLEDVFRAIMRNVELFVRLGYVHADLSPYNVLWWEESLWIIDFPQAVMTRHNPSATELLHRDISNVCRYFAKLGLERDPGELIAPLLDYIIFG